MQSLLRSLCVSAFSLVSCPVFASDEFAAKVCEAEMRSIQGALQALELDFRDVAVSLGVQEDVFLANQILRKLSNELCPIFKIVGRNSSPRPLLRPLDFNPKIPTEETELSLEDILREVKQSETMETSKLSSAPRLGPPLTGGEIAAFREQVSNCWSVNVGSRAANVTVTIGLEMQPDGRVVASSMELLAFEGGVQSDANKAFQAGRRAILRCQRDGYDLPKEKYNQWRYLKIKFDPSELRKR